MYSTLVVAVVVDPLFFYDFSHIRSFCVSRRNLFTKVKGGREAATPSSETGELV